MTKFKLNKKLECSLDDLVQTGQFSKNGWIAPNGDFYGCEGAEHYQSAVWIAVFILNLTQDDLKSGKFFKETFESKIRDLNWICIKDTSWLGIENHEDPNDFRKIFWTGEETKEQEKTVEEYLNFYS